MKNSSIFLLTILLTFSSCSSSDDGNPQENPEFAMTAQLNEVTFEANNPFGTNEFSSTNIWNYFPIDDFVLLQGRQGGVFGNPEINIWLKRSDIVIGTYAIGQETFSTPPSHFINLIDNSNQTSENTKAGEIEITEINATTKIVKGTFQFTTVDDLNDPAAPVGFNVTEGTFRYTYE